MEIHFEGNIYVPKKGLVVVENYVQNWVTLGFLQPIETKPTGYYEVQNGVTVPMGTFLGNETGETKPEENWDELNERQDREFRGERLVDHDKAMEIPEVKDCIIKSALSESEYELFQQLNSLKAVIKKINNL